MTCDASILFCLDCGWWCGWWWWCCRDAINRVSTGGGLETKNDIGGFAKQKNPMLNENISRVIRWYKGRVCFESRKKNTEFAWQPRFHDHIIRNTQSYEKIKNYIIENPSKWTDDKFYKP